MREYGWKEILLSFVLWSGLLAVVCGFFLCFYDINNRLECIEFKVATYEKHYQMLYPVSYKQLQDFRERIVK